MPVEELPRAASCAALHLAGRGRRAGRGEQVADAVLRADPVEEHRPRAVAEAAGEHLAVVGEDLVRHAMASAALGQGVAHRAGRGPGHHPSADTQKREWSSMPVTIFASRAVGQTHAAHHVHLPQLHRPGPLPALVVAPLAPTGLRGDQTVADQAAIHRRAPRHRVEPSRSSRYTIVRGPHPGCARRISTIRASTTGRHLMRARHRPRAPIGQPAQAPGPRSGATSRAPSGGPPHSAGPRRSPWPPSRTSNTA